MDNIKEGISHLLHPVPVGFANAKKVIACMDEVGTWDDVKDLLVEDAPFTCQADALAEVTTIKGWHDWMVNFKANICPDAAFTVHATAWDPENKRCVYSATFHATHTGDGGPVPATNKKANTEYCYQVDTNEEGKVTKMVKIWNDVYCLKQLGWA